jgi:hypothetical protein
MHRSSLSPLLILGLAGTLAAQATLGETPAPIGSAPPAPPSVAQPQYGPGTVPASLRNAFGNSNNNIPFSWTPCSYQQVFLGSELPATAYPILGLGLRQDDQFNSWKGYSIDMEMKLGVTTYNVGTLTNTFSSNYNVTPPTVVISRKVVVQPDMPTTNPTDPTVFFHQIRFDRPHVWTPSPTNNLLIEVRNHGNGSNNAIFTYPLDAGSGVNTTRLYGLTGPGDTSGTLGASYGMVMCFADKIKTTASYLAFGKGCPGTGGFAGDIVPAAQRASMGNSNNYFPFGRMNMLYQQVFLGSELPAPGIYQSMNLRQTSTTNGGPGGQVTFKLEVGYTTMTPASLSATYATNIDSGPLITMHNGTFNIPALTGTNTDPTKFTDFVIKFSQPWPYIPGPTKNLLFQCTNTSTADVLQFMDAHSGTTTTRLYATSATATTGTLGVNYGLIVAFGKSGGTGTATPVLASNGRPVINKSFDVTLGQAKASSAALLIFGSSNQTWGAIPLPLSLAFLGAPACNLLVAFDLFAVPTATDTIGTGKVTLAIPNDVALVNVTWHNQYLVADSAANSWGYSLTNGSTAIVGEQ